MINLLPPEQKEELFAREKLKIVLILGMIIIFFLISLGLVLFSVKMLISTDVQIQGVLVEEKEKELKNPKIEDLEGKIKEYNLSLLKLKGFYQGQKNLTAVLEKIPTILPDKIYLTALNLNPPNSQISLSGYSPSREILLEFKEKLEKSEDFKEIYFPPTNWVEPVDINFTVIFKFK